MNKVDRDTLRIHNDGKGKWQSFEARWGDFWGYGENEAEAIDDLTKAVLKTYREFCDLDKSNPVYVSWDDEEVVGLIT